MTLRDAGKKLAAPAVNASLTSWVVAGLAGIAAGCSLADRGAGWLAAVAGGIGVALGTLGVRKAK